MVHVLFLFWTVIPSKHPITTYLHPSEVLPTGQRSPRGRNLGSMNFMPMFWAFILLSLPGAPVFAVEFSGQVLGVVDGDTIDARHNTRAERIRLNSVDCPEKGQPYGKNAKQVACARFRQGSHPSHIRYGQGRLVLVVSKIFARQCCP